MSSSKPVVTEEKKPQVFALFSSLLIAYAITCIVFIAYAILITYSSITEQNISLVVTITGIISVAVAGFDSAKDAKSKGWLWGIIAGTLYGIILLCIGTFVNKGLSIDSKTITLLIICIAGGGLGGVVGINFGKK